MSGVSLIREAAGVADKKPARQDRTERARAIPAPKPPFGRRSTIAIAPLNARRTH